MAITAIAFVAFYLSGLLAAFASHPKWGLFTYIAVFYLHPPLRWWGAALPESMRWSLLAAAVTAFAVPKLKTPANAIPWNSFGMTKVMIAYVGWMWVQTLWANPAHFEGVILMTKYILLFYLIYRIVGDEQRLADFGLMHVLGCFYFGLLALDAEGTGRLEFIGGPGANDSNTLGMHVVTGLFFAGSLILSRTGWRRWVVLLTVPVLANCVIQTESRGAFLGAACGGLVYLFMAPSRHRKFIASLGAAGVLILLAYAPSTYWERMATIGAATDETQEIDNSSMARIALFKAQLEMFADYPFGLGFDTTTYLSRGYLATEWLTANPGVDVATHGARSSHNTLLSVLTDQGIPGIILAVIGIVATLRLMNRLRRTDLTSSDESLMLYRASICAALTVIFVSGMFTNYIKAEVQVWCLALLAATYQIAQTRVSSERQKVKVSAARSSRHGYRQPEYNPSKP